MIRVKIFAIIVLMAIFMVGVSYAENVKTNITPANKCTKTSVCKKDALAHKPGMKAERGMKNILLGWTDIPKSIIQVTKDSKNPIWGLTGGTLQGIGKAFPRTVSGIVDVVSFPIGDYDKSPVHPDALKAPAKTQAQIK